MPFLGADKEHQVIYAKERLEKQAHINYFIFGHRHVPFRIRISPSSEVICLGDWISNFTYAVFDGEQLKLKKAFADRGEIITV